MESLENVFCLVLLAHFNDIILNQVIAHGVGLQEVLNMLGQSSELSLPFWGHFYAVRAILNVLEHLVDVVAH